MNWKEYVFQGFVVVAIITVVVFFLPHEDRSKLHYEVGKPWAYNKLIAPFDFPIYKDEAQLKQESDSLDKLYAPYFTRKDNVGKEQVKLLEKALTVQNESQVNRQYKELIKNILDTAYQHGIISDSDHEMLSKEKPESVFIHHQKIDKSMLTCDLQSVRQVYESFLITTNTQNDLFPQVNFQDYIIPNLEYNKELSEARKEDLKGSLVPTLGIVQAGEMIVDRNVVVDGLTYRKLVSYETVLADRRMSDVEYNWILGGQVIYVTFVVLCMLLYLHLFRNDYLHNWRKLLLLTLLVLVFPFAASMIVRHNVYSVYLLPYAMLPIFVRVFMDSRTAFVAHMCSIMLCAAALHYPFEFVATQCVAGLVSIYSLRELSERSQIIRTAIYVTVAALAFYLSIELIHGRRLFTDDSLKMIDFDMYIHMIIGGVLLLFAYPLMFVLERLFGFTSNVTLVELSNINHEVLRRLSEVAPGTFQHSMQVSNLSAEVARQIGANSQLVRTGALYHDIGKIYNPPFFTENQTSGTNPHNELSYEDSARVIIRHVTEGLQYADKCRLPKVIKDFIATHHGRGLVKYFYISYKNKYPDQPVDESIFTYPGPNPFTAEQAILMMSDAVEAASRSLKEYTEESIGKLVDGIIDGQIREGYFNNCPITYLDIQTAKRVFKEKLTTIYHTRISYPKLNKSAEEQK